MRLDKFLCEMNIGSRSQVKQFIRQGQVGVNSQIITSPEYKVSEDTDQITFCGEVLCFQPFHYYMLNKPAGVVSATRDNTARTVVELLPPALRKDIFPVGRLDIDTTGLLLLTDDGALSHALLSPGKHVDKTYLVAMEAALSPADIAVLEEGVDIGEQKRTLPARVEVVSEKEILLTIHEGRYHQVKRMLHAVGNGVRSLKRISFGGLALDESLAEGGYRELTDEELALLKRINFS